MVFGENEKYNFQLVKDIIGWDIKNWSIALNYWENEIELDYTKCIALEIGAGGEGYLSG